MKITERKWPRNQPTSIRLIRLIIAMIGIVMSLTGLLMITGNQIMLSSNLQLLLGWALAFVGGELLGIS